MQYDPFCCHECIIDFIIGRELIIECFFNQSDRNSEMS